MCLNARPAYILGKTPAGKFKLGFKPSAFSFCDSPSFFVPCGRCPECQEMKRKQWSKRMLCQLFVTPSASFVTLTYNDCHLPSDGKVHKEHIQKFIKKLRNISRDYGISISDKFKYFIVPEYGSKFGRPHYHGILFDIDFLNNPAWRSYIALFKDGRPLWSSKLLEKIWSYGFVSFDECNARTINYVTKYITKSLSDCPWRLCSIGIGKRLFVGPDGLLPFAEQCIDNGFVVLPYGKNMSTTLPKFLDRYIERYDISRYNAFKRRRQEFAKAKTMDSRSLAERLNIVRTKIQRENQKRKLDNES